MRWKKRNGDGEERGTWKCLTGLGTGRWGFAFFLNKFTTLKKKNYGIMNGSTKTPKGGLGGQTMCMAGKGQDPWGSSERAKQESVKVGPQLQWRIQNTGDLQHVHVYGMVPSRLKHSSPGERWLRQLNTSPWKTTPEVLGHEQLTSLRIIRLTKHLPLQYINCKDGRWATCRDTALVSLCSAIGYSVIQQCLGLPGSCK